MKEVNNFPLIGRVLFFRYGPERVGPTAFVRQGHGVEGTALMPGARYYREQAQLLLGWALATSDPDDATLLRTRAMELLAKSNLAGDNRESDCNPAIDEFNDGEFRKRVAQHQQQIQPESDK